ncbi:MAG: ATP-binding protein [Betaproteobacteria bacterium]|nr:ATP-binding protein [Betaproteobacteria bacterium]
MQNLLTSSSLEAQLRNANPWWRGERLFGVPPIRRWAFEVLLRGIDRPIAPVTVLRGPRQIGKTTLVTQIVEDLLAKGVDPRRIFRVQFDDLPELRRLPQPILDLAQWYADEILERSLNKAAHELGKCILILDEVQNLPDWATQLKHLVDLQPVTVIVTGSSALRIEAGRDSLAGRISTVEMGPLLLREIVQFQGGEPIAPLLQFNGLSPLKEKTFWQELRAFGVKHGAARSKAFAAFSERGAYPVAQANIDEPWERIADQLNETVVRRAIQHDLRMGAKGRKRDEHLLEEVFRLACRYVGQSPTQGLYLDEIRGAMNANVGWQSVLAYLKFLDGTLLLRLIEPLELRLKKKKGASKLCLCDHALRAAWLQEIVPLDPVGLAAAPHLSDLAGRIAESAAGYFLRSIVGLDVAHFPERGAEPEIDFVLTVGTQRIPVEIKYRRRIGHEDTRGLRSFIEKTHYNAPFGILVTLGEEVGSDDPRIVSMPLSTLLMMR